MNFTFSSPPARQPRTSDAHPCTTPCARRRAVHRAAWISNRFHLATRLAPAQAHGSATTRALMTSHRQQVCAPLLPRRCTGMRSQDNDRHPTLRPSKPLQYAQSARQPAHRQPRVSGAHPCTAPCARRCRPTTQCESRTGFTLPLRLAPAHAYGSATTSHNTPPRHSNDSRVHSSPNPNH